MGFDEKKRWRVPLLVLSQVFGLGASVMLVYYTVAYGGGLDSSKGPEILFNYHPILMIVGMVYLNGTTIMLYRAFSFANKSPVKIAHLMLQFLVMVLSISGLVIVFVSSTQQGYTHLQSLHSWLGLLTASSFTAQWMLSVVIFTVAAVPNSIRAAYKVLHVYVGGAIFISAVCSVLCGLIKIEAIDSVLISANVIGLSVMCFAFIVGIVIMTDAYRRPDASYTSME